MNRIDAIFEKKRRDKESAMIFYITSGYPDLERTATVIDGLVAGGTDIIEMGMPFSDPIADGPTIQKSSYEALQGGMNTGAFLKLIAETRAKHADVGLVVFGAFNPMLHYGQAEFVKAVAEAGADGFIVPDLPPEAAGEFLEACKANGLTMSFLIAPTTRPERAQAIADAASGFIYYVSIMGVTGARTELATDLEEKLSELRKITDKPLAVGFGVSQPEHARWIAEHAEGVVVGSALIKLVGQYADSEELGERVREYAQSMTDALHKPAVG